MSDDIDRLEQQVAITARHWRVGQIFFAVLAVIVGGAGAAKGAWFLVAIAAGLFGGMVGLLAILVKRSDWDKNPVLQTLRDCPGEISEVKHVVASSSSGSFAHSFFQIRNTDGHHFGLRIREDDLIELASLLRRRCPAAHFEGPAFSA